MNPLKLGISPCPNDTFIFEGWVSGKTQGPEVQTLFADVQTLNEAAIRAELDVVKVSSGVLGLLPDDYVVLHAGGAMGYGCGPLLLGCSCDPFDPSIDTWLPGRHTTATVLFSHWMRTTFPASTLATTTFAPFDQVYRNLMSGKARQGVVIHEHRFTWQRDDLHLIQDLGAHWEKSTGSPIPLGVILARKSLGSAMHLRLEETIRESLSWAWARGDLVSEFIRNHAQDTDTSVMESHIRMFVNDFSMDMGADGKKALQILREIADKLP